MPDISLVDLNFFKGTERLGSYIYAELGHYNFLGWTVFV